MNLLPKSKEEFSQKDYWDTFFRKRGAKAFEWYGEYPELSEYLHKYIKKQDEVLIIGCGNSSLGRDLFDIGYDKITNIDISPVVIRQMLSQQEKERVNLKYIQMDALNMSFTNDEFTVVLDKGTLDAIAPNDSEATLLKVKSYFDEINRVLRIRGRYICISLLQEHILRSILDFFPKNNFMFRVVRCFEAEQKASESGENTMPVFMIICTKFKDLPSKVLEVNLSASEKMQRSETEENVIAQVLNSQNAALICSGLKRSSIAEENEVVLDLFEQGVEIPRFTVYVVDVPPKKKNSQYAGFIVPEGREAEWLFSTKAGRKKLVDVTQFNRLAIITLHREHKYESFEAVQKELSDTVCNLAPSHLKNKKIAFLSLGSDVGHRIIRHKGHSEISGEYVIEDVLTENEEKYRRLFFMSSQLVIQSEAKLRAIKSRRGAVKEVIDLMYLTCRHHIYMSMATYVACKNRHKALVAVVGLGGGGLCSFLHKFLPKSCFLGIDIDKDMLNIATNWFGFKQDDKLKAKIQDGIEYLKETAEKGEKLDALLFDADSKDSSIGLSCPPKQFLDESVLKNVVEILGTTGLFIVNVVLRDQSMRPELLNNIKKHFEAILSYKLQDDLNEIFICSKSKIKMDTLKDGCRELNNFFRKHNISENSVDLDMFMTRLVSQSILI
ncbi:eEF1A lysine and N-terminal methyltransferase homolog [Leptinotarsa decemlineata]|uniref:eEF1A lysine and N-terminal methyltransferase homolog n=1 Tax=Leptinotarsa decemlineata TaxID=7539 RepID=UPI003D30877A